MRPRNCTAAASAKRGGHRHDGQVLLRQDLTHQDDERHEGHRGEEEAMPGQLQRRATRLAAQDLPVGCRRMFG